MIKFVDFLTELFGSRGAVIFGFWASSVGAVTLNKFSPDFFVGLPAWVFPTLWLVVIFSTVGLATILFDPFVRGVGQVASYCSKPFRQRRLEKKLLSLSLDEILCLSKGLASGKMLILYPPNIAPVFSLLDKGLIVRKPVFIPNSGSNEGFMIPEIVWRKLLQMREFDLQSPDLLMSVIEYDNCTSGADVANFLPAEHPTVIGYLSQEEKS